MEIYLLRHGMTEWNYQFKIQGSSDIPLHEVGLKMAEETGAALKEKGITFDRVYSSPLIRAVQSAKAVSGREDIITDELLKEMCFGIQEGVSLLEENDGKALFEYFKKNPAKYDEAIQTEPSIESFAALCSRAASFLKDVIEEPVHERESRDGIEKEIREDGRSGRILISGHGALNQALLMHMKKESDIMKFWEDGLMPNCGIHRIHYSEETGEYRFIEKHLIYYSDELYQMSPRLFK